MAGQDRPTISSYQFALGRLAIARVSCLLASHRPTLGNGALAAASGCCVDCDLSLLLRRSGADHLQSGPAKVRVCTLFRSTQPMTRCGRDCLLCLQPERGYRHRDRWRGRLRPELRQLDRAVSRFRWNRMSRRVLAPRAFCFFFFSLSLSLISCWHDSRFAIRDLDTTLPTLPVGTFDPLTDLNCLYVAC